MLCCRIGMVEFWFLVLVFINSVQFNYIFFLEYLFSDMLPVCYYSCIWHGEAGIIPTVLRNERGTSLGVAGIFRNQCYQYTEILGRKDVDWLRVRSTRERSIYIRSPLALTQSGKCLLIHKRPTDIHPNVKLTNSVKGEAVCFFDLLRLRTLARTTPSLETPRSNFEVGNSTLYLDPNLYLDSHRQRKEVQTSLQCSMTSCDRSKNELVAWKFELVECGSISALVLGRMLQLCQSGLRRDPKWIEPSW